MRFESSGAWTRAAERLVEACRARRPLYRTVAAATAVTIETTGPPT